MNWIEKNYEKLVIAIVAVLAIGFGAKHILGVMSFDERFVLSHPPKGTETPTPNEARVAEASAILTADKLDVGLFQWEPREVPIANSNFLKKVPLMRSVQIVEHNNKVYDLDNPSEAAIRAPIPNSWFAKYDELEILSQNVLSNDPDIDGFTNLEEWQSDPQTSPIDNADHPPYTNKLLFVKREGRPFWVAFRATNKSANGDQYQINTKLGSRSKSVYVRVGESFFNDRFVIKEFREKEGKNASGITADISEIDILDTKNNRQFTIIKKVPKNWPDYRAEFNFTLDSNQSKFYVLEGETFTLDLEPNRIYRLLKIDEDAVTLDGGDGKAITLARGALQLPGAEAANGAGLDGL